MPSKNIESRGSGPIRTVFDRPLSIILIGLVFAIPTLIPPVLPLTDLGGHLGRFAVQLDGGRDAQLGQWYSFRWLLLPNLGVDLLIQLLGPIVGLEPALRVIVAITVVLKASGILLLSKLVHGRLSPFALFALPLIYSHSFVFGFLNYNLSLGLLWFCIALWILLERCGDDRRRWLAFALVSTAMWTCHLVGWALLCIGAGAREFIRQYDRKGGVIPAAAACVLPLSCLLAPWAIKLLSLQPATGVGKSGGFFLLWTKVNRLFEVLRDQWYIFDIVSFQVIALVLVLSIVTKYAKWDRGLGLAAAVTAICVVVVPHKLLGSEYADQRLIEPMLVFALLAIRPSLEASRKMVLGMFAFGAMFSGIRLASNAVSLQRLGSISARNLEILEALPRNAQMINFRLLPCPAIEIPWTIDRRTHLGGYAIARRHAFSNDQWEIPGAQLLRIHNPAAGPFQADETQMQYEVPCRGQPDIMAAIRKVPEPIPYLWVNWDRRPPELDGWRVVARNGGSVLYRRTDS